MPNCHNNPSFIGDEECTRTCLDKLFEHPQGSGTSRHNSRDIPDSSLRNPRKTNFQGRARAFWAPPLSRGRPPPHRAVSGPKQWIFVLFFSCLTLGWVRTASGPFSVNNFHPLFIGFKMGFCRCPDMGPKRVQSGFGNGMGTATFQFSECSGSLNALPNPSFTERLSSLH